MPVSTTTWLQHHYTFNHPTSNGLNIETIYHDFALVGLLLFIQCSLPADMHHIPCIDAFIAYGTYHGERIALYSTLSTVALKSCEFMSIIMPHDTQIK